MNILKRAEKYLTEERPEWRESSLNLVADMQLEIIGRDIRTARIERELLKIKAASLAENSHCAYRTRYEHCDLDGKICEPYGFDHIERCPIKSEWEEMAKEWLEELKRN